MASKRKKIVIIILSSLGGLLLAVFIAAMILLSMIFDSEPQQMPQNIPDPETYERALKKITGGDEGEEGTMAKMLKILQSDTVTLEFSEDEVNALVGTALGGKEAYDAAKSGKTPGDGSSYVRFQDDSFNVLYSKKLNFWTPFGSFVNINTSVQPGLKDRHIALNMNHLYVGSLKIPDFIVRWQIEKALPEVEKDQKIQEIFDVVDDITVKDKSLYITYRPKELALFLMKSANIPKMFAP